MPVIAAFNSKGGSAKSTALIVLADALARTGASVSVIDTDPQRTIAHWRERAQTSSISVIEELSSTRIHKVITEATSKSAFVFVDMAGFTSDMRTPVISKSDLVIVPMQASYEDARLAARAFELISADEETLSRPVDKRVLWARTSPALRTRVERNILAEIVDNEVPSFVGHLYERAPFKAMMSDGVPLGELDAGKWDADGNAIPKAIANADALAAELVDYIMSKRAKASAAQATAA